MASLPVLLRALRHPRIKSMLKWSLIRGLVFLFPIAASAQTAGAFSIGNPQIFGITLQPVNLLSNRMALPWFESHLDYEGSVIVPDISPGRLTLQTLPFALDPLAARTMAPRSVPYP